MTSATSVVRSKFRGCLMGGVLGDCLGSPFEGDTTVGRTFLANYFNKLMDKNKNLQIYSYTDDTAMLKSVAESLIECKEFDSKDLARRFTEEYFRQPMRRYGSTVKDTFHALKETDYEDVFEPARHQFRGEGSLGNGAAMRTAPTALFAYHLTVDDVIELTRQQSLITHSHPYGYNGAILQALAVHQALKLSSANGNEQPSPNDFKIQEFLDMLIENMQKVEDGSPSINTGGGRSGDRIRLLKPSPDSHTPYTDSLKKMKEILSERAHGSDLSPEEIVLHFGNSVSAPKSVPTSIYCVLRAHSPIPYLETEDVVLRSMYLAISVGGDTDTIATMACAITGAMYGEESISPVLIKHCEFHERARELADKLYDIAETKKQ